MAVSKRVRSGIRIFFVVYGVAAFSWLFYSMQARGVDPSVLASGDAVRVRVTEETIRFEPVVDTSTVGLIFYPGALVDPKAYAPLARQVAEAGHRVAIVKIPFRVDVFDWQQQKVLERTRAVLSEGANRTWVIGGHSRGGKVAARLAGGHPEWFAGLLLVGTSHPREDDLSHLQIDVVKVYGSEDGLASEAEIEEFAHNLPAGTRFVRVVGGNHRQFGYYGWQLGDGRATIDRAAQHQQTVGAILEQLKRVSPGRTIPQLCCFQSSTDLKRGEGAMREVSRRFVMRANKIYHHGKDDLAAAAALAGCPALGASRTKPFRRGVEQRVEPAATRQFIGKNDA